MTDDSDRAAGWLDEFRPFPEEHALYRGAARRSGLETAHWARQVLNRAARSLLDLAPPDPVDELHRALAQVQAKEELQHFLADATALLAESLDLGETLRCVARLSIPVFADWCLLDVFSPSQRLERMAVAHADPAHAGLADEVRAHRPELYANAQYPATRVMLGQAPVLIEEFDAQAARAAARDDAHLALIERLGVRSVICVALAARGKTLGFLTFMTAGSGRRYGAGDVVVAQDIARRCALAIENAQLFEEARSALRIRDEFLKVASHELRTTLTPLQLQVEALGRKFADFVKSGKETWLEKRLTSIRRQTARLEHLVEELLGMSNIVGGSISLRPAPADLTALVEAAVARFHEQHPDQEVDLDLVPTVPGRWDHERLGEVLGNLLANAHRHGRGRPIGLTAARDGEWAVVTVTDERVDVVPRDHRRASSIRSPQNYGGLGVGLFVTRQIVDAMGGSIEARSGEQGGAIFTVRLPLVAAPAVTPDEHPGLGTVH